jgi:hypothetical protein
VAKNADAAEMRIVSPKYSPLPPMPYSSHTTIQNLVPIWLPHGLLKKKSVTLRTLLGFFEIAIPSPWSSFSVASNNEISFF